MIKEYVMGILNAEQQPELLKTVNAIWNAVDLELLSNSKDFDSKLHNFIYFFLLQFIISKIPT